MNSTTPVRRVEIVLDPACVWCYLGYTYFARAAKRYRAEGGVLEVVLRPFQVDPKASTQGERLLDVLRRDLGEGAEQAKTRVNSIAVRDDIPMDFERTVNANTFEAHRLIAMAGRQGLAEQMIERVFRAHHTEGANLADLEVLAKLAAEVGVAVTADGADELRVEMERVRRSGVRGVPVFRFEGGPALSGAQSEETLSGALRH